jgi:PIN domain-containing protein
MGKARRARPLTLDAGALVAIERHDRTAGETIRVALEAGLRVMIPACALAQVWRDGRRQVRLVRLLRLEGVHVTLLNEKAAKAAGELCRRTGTRDVVDARVVVCAHTQRDSLLLTSDPDDIRRLDPRLDLERI